MNFVLVTGANGQLGQCINRISPKYPDLKFVFASSKEVDITEPSSINKIFDKYPFKYCINCAAYTNVEKAETEPEKAFLVNAEGSRLLAIACKSKQTTLIHVSTDYVFDGKKTSPYKTSDSPNPINVYGASKLKGEHYIQNILNKFFIIRTSWLYSEIGSNFYTIISKKLKTESKLTVINDQTGRPTNAIDLAAFILSILKKESTAYGIQHFAGPNIMTWFDFANAIAKKHGATTPIEPVSSVLFKTIAKRPKYSVLEMDS